MGRILRSTNQRIVCARSSCSPPALSQVTWDLFLRGTNLTNAEARVHTSFLKEIAPLPGRNLTVGLRSSF